MATAKKQIASQPAVDDGQVIEFVKRTVIGSVTYKEFGGDYDIMSAFFSAVERDARDGMTSDTVSIDEYEMQDNLGTTKVRVQHTPNGR